MRRRGVALPGLTVGAMWTGFECYPSTTARAGKHPQGPTLDAGARQGRMGRGACSPLLGSALANALARIINSSPPCGGFAQWRRAHSTRSRRRSPHIALTTRSVRTHQPASGAPVPSIWMR
jgi:hypothetical protein